MKKLSNINEARVSFVFHGKDISFDFKDICELAWENERFRDKLMNRKRVYRNYELFKKFLKNVYDGDLPKDVHKLTQRLKYDQMSQDLFYMDETGFKNYYPEYYNSLYNDLSDDEKLDVFWMCDCGGRSVLEYKQDVLAGNLYEDMLVYHSKGILTQNQWASGRGTARINTLCDLVFKSPKKPGYPYVEAPVEVKTRFGRTIKDTIQVRGNSNKIRGTKGIIMCVYPLLSKAILVDMSKPQEITKGNMSNGKECDLIKVNPDDFFDFKCWENDDMKKLLHMIYEMRKEETK